ncbi:MAG: NAD(P)H-dependent glycerol-3-phosphate dehydrogenase [Myxococcota bacterium]
MAGTAVLGAGSFGTALATLFARVSGERVWLWSHNPEQAQAINETRHNPRYLSEYELHSAIRATGDLSEALEGVDKVVVAIPSQAVRSLLTDIAERIPEVPLVLAAKGIENDTLMTLDEVVQDVLGPDWSERTLALSGPSFAKEILQGYPTAVVLACANQALADQMSESICVGAFRAYSSSDIVGVELGGALKNVMAIAAGGITGMGFGHNTRTAMVTRGLAEITRLAVAKGAHPMTLAGLAGMGDLVLTCTGGLSRNRRLGEMLGGGKDIDEATEEIGQVVEGVRTTLSAYQLAEKLGVDAPITQSVYRVLYEGASLKTSVQELLARPSKREREY